MYGHVPAKHVEVSASGDCLLVFPFPVYSQHPKQNILSINVISTQLTVIVLKFNIAAVITNVNTASMIHSYSIFNPLISNKLEAFSPGPWHILALFADILPQFAVFLEPY